MLRFIYYVLIFGTLNFLGTYISYAQQNDKIAELKKKLETLKNDTNKIKTLIDLSWEIKAANPSESRKYSEEAIKLSRELNYKVGLALGYKNKGVAFYYQNLYDSAIACYEIAIKYMREIGDKMGEAKIFNNIGMIYEMKTDLPKALDNYLKYLKISEAQNEKQDISKALNNIGLVYWRYENYKNHYEIALDYHKRALKLRQELNDQSGIATSYSNIGLVYDSKASEISNKKLFGEKSKSLAKTYWDTSLNYFNMALEIRQKLDEKRNVAQTMSNIANVLWNLNKKENAKEYHNQILKIYEEIGDQTGLALQYHNIGITYFQDEDYNKALEMFKKSLELCLEIQYYELAQSNYNIISQCYYNMGNYKMAYDYQVKFINIKDSLFTEESSRALSELQTLYDTEKKQKEIELLNKDNELKQAQLRNSQILIYFFIGAFILVTIFVIFIFRAYKQKQKANKLLAEQKEEIQYQAQQLELANIELEKLSIVASETDNGVVIADENGNIEWVNNGFTKLFGYTLEEFIKEKGKNIYEASSNTQIKEVITKAIKEKRSIVYDSPTKTKDGREIWVQTTLTPIFKNNGELRKIVTIDSDITKIKQAEEEIRRQKEEIEIKNKHITDSIRYAKRIQQAILPPISAIQKIEPESFILFKPKDIVSGDFYWLDEKNGKILFSAVDCTGHGVPGAFMSIVGTNILNQALHEQNLTKPSDILNYLSNKVNATLRRDKEQEDNTVKDGMDLALCALDRKNMILEFAGVHNPMYIVRNKEILQFKPENHPIGEPFNESFTSYTNNVIPVEKGDIIYVFSDGYVDQFGGPSRKKFMSKRFKETLIAISHLPMQQQKEELNRIFEEWRGDIEQYDDVLVMGVKV